MRRISQIVALLALCGSCFGQTSEYRNAATHYQRAFERFGSLTAEEWIILGDYDGSSGPPTQAVRDALRKAQPILNDFNRGTLQPYSDFHLDFSQGFDMLIPHLGNMRQIARLAAADVAVRLYDGDTAGAADRLTAMGRSIAHYNDDRTMISSLVGQAVFNLTDATLQTGLDHAAFNAGDAMRILQPLDQLASTGDPFGLFETVVMEQEWMVMAITQQFERGELAELFEWLDGPVDDMDRWESLTQEEFDLNVAAYDEFMNDVVEIFAMEDYEAAAAEMVELYETFRDSEFNLFAAAVSGYERVLETRGRGEKLLADRIATLRELVEGDVEPLEIANAAVWYLRGIEMLDEAPTEAIAALREVKLFWDDEMPEAVVTLLEVHGRSIVEQFRAGSEIRRCDFSIARDGASHSFSSRYAAGMRDAFRLLHADAIRLMKEDEAEHAAERLAICYRVVGHLSGDDQLLSSLISHVAFEHTHILAAFALDTEQFDPQHAVALGSAFDRIGRADPFGYGGATRSTRSAVIEFIGRRIRHFLADDDEINWLTEVVRGVDSDRLLSMLLFHDELSNETLRRSVAQGYVTGQVESRVDVEALADVLTVDALEPLREQCQAMVIQLLDRELDVTRASRLPVATDIRQRREQARSVLRIGATLFQSIAPTTAEEAVGQETVAEPLSNLGGE